MADVNPIDALNTPLWCVYGPDSFPSLLLCKVIGGYPEGPVIWGFSIYRRKPGFRTLGISLDKWMTREKNPVFFTTQKEALDMLAELTQWKE